jgi:FkbM family methyltransferase
MFMSLRGIAKSWFRKMGYAVHPESRSCLLKDSFADQQALLSRLEVERIFDLGANSGQTTSQYRSLFPKAIIYSFEPFSEPFNDLIKSFDDDRFVKPFQFAVTDICGSKSLYVNKSSFTNSLLPSVETIGVYENIETNEVKVITIDAFCDQEAIDEIHILKMDIQGGELMALRGARDKLASGKVHLIYTEVLFAPLYKGQAQFHELCELLCGFEYGLYDLYNLNHNEDGTLAWGDAIFLSPQLRANMNSGSSSAL